MATRIEPAHALLFPYLWIRDRIRVGPYELVSRNVFTDDDFLSPQIRSDVEGLLTMYEVNASMANRFGTVVRHLDGRIGDSFKRQELKPLHQAIVAALLDPIPQAIGKKDETPGWSIPTSDNALIYLHQLDGSGYVAVEYGRMVTTLVGGLKIGEEHSQIHAPSEIHTPFLGHDPDPEYTAALYPELTAGTAEARRLGRAIEWLDLAWRNTNSIDDDTRIGAIYNASRYSSTRKARTHSPPHSHNCSSLAQRQR
jgi:hypothetical protein